MPHPKFETARRRLVPVAALLVATVLGGCVAYTGYPSGYYGYNYPSGYYGGNRGGYAYPAYNSYNQRPVYSSDYNSSFNAYENSGGGR
jgi:hypothetical protein